MTGSAQPDVIIAGAGIAGSTLALALAQAGLRPLLIDPVAFDDQIAPRSTAARQPSPTLRFGNGGRWAWPRRWNPTPNGSNRFW